MKRAIAVALAALAIALAIYLAARDGLLLHAIAPPLPIDGRGWPSFVRFVVPDGLWQLAFCACVLAVWRDARRSAWAIACCALPIAIGVGCELGQALDLVEGVFDPLDLVATLLGGALAVALVGTPGRSAAIERNDACSAVDRGER